MCICIYTYVFIYRPSLRPLRLWPPSAVTSGAVQGSAQVQSLSRKRTSLWSKVEYIHFQLEYSLWSKVEYIHFQLKYSLWSKVHYIHFQLKCSRWSKVQLKYSHFHANVFHEDGSLNDEAREAQWASVRELLPSRTCLAVHTARF